MWNIEVFEVLGPGKSVRASFSHQPELSEQMVYLGVLLQIPA